MGNRITLLPDNVANQIAAGEVVQRPASAVKELLENAIDAGADSISLHVVDSGKSLIQVSDNGDGMSETDLRMAFERHATSKISTAEDLFKLSTKGFRGEALASIAAVAQVHCKSKLEEEDLASELKIEGSKVVSQSYTSGKKGTSIIVKNLFYNIPARRNFLKSNQVEFKHIIDEFERVALPHFNIQFKLNHNQSEIFNLNKGNFRQRIVAVFGNKFNERLVPVEENTDLIAISGFIVKPKYAKRTRGEQFFFVNNRFIKSPFLHRAVLDAYSGLIGTDQFPSYFIGLNIDPSHIDVNIHPTKTEIKFDDEQAIFAILKASVKKSLGQFNVAPSIDFETDLQFHIPPAKANTYIPPPRIDIDPEYNPFEEDTVVRTAEKRAKGTLSTGNWEQLYSGIEKEPEESQTEMDVEQVPADSATPMLLQGKYLLHTVKSGIMVVNIKRALERIFYQDFITQLTRQSGVSQQLLFPISIGLSAGDVKLIHGMEHELSMLGFDIEFAGLQNVVVKGLPIVLGEGDAKEALEAILESSKLENPEVSLKQQEQMAQQLAMLAALKHNRKLSVEEQRHLVDRLFACENPYISLKGKSTIAHIKLDEIDKYFN